MLNTFTYAAATASSLAADRALPGVTPSGSNRCTVVLMVARCLSPIETSGGLGAIVSGGLSTVPTKEGNAHPEAGDRIPRREEAQPADAPVRGKAIERDRDAHLLPGPGGRQLDHPQRPAVAAAGD